VLAEVASSEGRADQGAGGSEKASR
jgi:hypothetical protein